MNLPPIYLTGPTASGKSQISLELARRIDAEIISLDSMALYRGLDIGTAKPTAADRALVPHHLVDLIEPEQEYSLAQYIADAERIAAEIASRERAVLFVGGTPLYLKSLLRGIFEGPTADWELRHRWEAEAAVHEPEWLHAEVARVDPATARKLHARDTRRLIRALEVFEKTGQPISQLQQQFDRARPAEACAVFVLDWPRELLYDRINRRVDEMFAAGLLEEVRALLTTGRKLGRTASQAVGYREVLDYLAAERQATGLAGRQNLPETVELVKQHTRQFAKRQLTWFRSLSECRWIDMTTTTPKEIVDTIETAWRRLISEARS